MKFGKTITTMFFVPTLGIDRDKMRANEFSNGYIKDARRDVQYENAVYLLFRPKDLDKFKDFLDDEYERTANIIDDYDYEDGYVVVVYKLDEKFDKDFSLIKEGKYSKVSQKFQNIFPKMVKDYASNKVTLQFRIFNKTQDLREFWEEKLGMELDDDMEVWYTFDEEKETLDLEKIKADV